MNLRTEARPLAASTTRSGRTAATTRSRSATENAVHSLEHGAVWITYSPDLPKDQINSLQERATNQTYLLVSPMKDLPSPVVASAWGKQVQLESADSPDLDRFIRAYRQGSQTPEPGAACTGGVGQPS